MGLVNGATADAPTINAAFLDKNSDTSTTHVLSLNCTTSGNPVTDVQSQINANTAAIASASTTVGSATSSNTPSTLVARDGSGNFAAGVITANLTGNVSGSVSGSAASFTGTLAGDVTGTQGMTAVATVGGSTAAKVHSAEVLANAATSANTASTLVARDASGNFSAGTITASLTGNVSGTSANVTGVVAIANGGTGKTTQAAALTALTGTQTAGQYVRSDGTNSALSGIQAADIPTLNQNTTGTAGNVTGIVAKANGGSGQSNANLNFPTTGTLATLAGVESLTNKTLTTPEITDAILLDTQGSTPGTPASGKVKLYSKSVDNRLYYLNSAGTEAAVGSGSGSGSGATNYISNYNFSSGLTSGWSLFNTTLTNKIPTGSITTGASSITTFAASNSNPLNNQSGYNLQVGSSAAITAGQGFISDTFTVDRERVATMLSASFAYEIVSGLANLSLTGNNSGSFGIFFYDVIGGAWIQPSGSYSIMQGPLPGQARPITFQSTGLTTNLQYRMAIVCITATAGAATINFNDFNVGPQSIASGFAGTDLVVAGTNTISATTTAPTKGTITTDIVRLAKRGDHAKIKGEYKQTAAGTAGSGDYLFSLPNNLSFDSNKVSFFTAVVGQATWASQVSLGSFSMNNGTSQHVGVVLPYDATHFRLASIYDQNGANGYGAGVVGSGYGSLSNGAITISYDFEAPILGWSCNVGMSSDVQVRSTSTQVYNNVSYSSTANAALPYNVGYDTGSNYNSSLSRYVASAPGIIDVAVNGCYRPSGTGYNINIYKNGSFVQTLFGLGVAGAYYSGFTQVPVVTNDYIDIRTDGAYSIVPGTATFTPRLGPVNIAAGETVNFRATNTAGTSIASTATLVPFANIDYDSHGSWSGSQFNVKTPGKFNVNCKLTSAAISMTAAQAFKVFLYKNGVLYSEMGAQPGSGTSSNFRASGEDDPNCVVGDYLQIYSQSDAGTVALYATAGYNYLAIKKLGN